MNDYLYIVKRKGSSDLYCGVNNKPIQYDDEDYAWEAALEASRRTPYEWEAVVVRDYYGRYHPSAASEEPE